MQSYLVGGAVRDSLLGLSVKERDYVVVGASAEQMLAQGYRQVGRDFPIFLHPQTHEEYALARTLRNQGATESEPFSDINVTLEEDLARRDLTINAIAQAPDGELIDPFGGEEDIRKGVLRHVSPVFAEDPVRVLRVARFMARYSDMGFSVAPETMTLMRKLAQEGALDELVSERIWQELVKALMETDPPAFFTTLRESGALARVFPEIDQLFGVPQPTHWHPEVDCGVHTLMALRVACELSDSAEVRFAVLTHDLGKATTPNHILPSHYGHEGRGTKLVKQLCQRIRAPSEFRDLAMSCASYHGYTHRLYELRAKTVEKLLSSIDSYRRPQRLKDFLLVCESDYRGREGFHARAYPQAKDLWRLYEAASQVKLDGDETQKAGWLKGEIIRRKRIKRITEMLPGMGAQQESLSPRQVVKDPETGDIGADG
jgi:tRNA nucleotidyltransferase (CCA-adding enzyme)